MRRCHWGGPKRLLMIDTGAEDGEVVIKHGGAESVGYLSCM